MVAPADVTFVGEELVTVDLLEDWPDEIVVDVRVVEILHVYGVGTEECTERIARNVVFAYGEVEAAQEVLLAEGHRDVLSSLRVGAAVPGQIRLRVSDSLCDHAHIFVLVEANRYRAYRYSRRHCDARELVSELVTFARARTRVERSRRC
jgi:hypothetical protein